MNDKIPDKFVQEIFYLKTVKRFAPFQIRMVTGLNQKLVNSVYHRKAYANVIIQPELNVIFKQRYGCRPARKVVV